MPPTAAQQPRRLSTAAHCPCCAHCAAAAAVRVEASWTWKANSAVHSRPAPRPAAHHSSRQHSTQHRRVKTTADAKPARSAAPPLLTRQAGVVFPDKILRYACTPEERAQFTGTLLPTPSPVVRRSQQPHQLPPPQQYLQQSQQPPRSKPKAIKAPHREKSALKPSPGRDGATSRLQRSRSVDSFHPEHFLRSATVSPLSHVYSRPSSRLSTISLEDSILTDSTFNVAAMSPARHHHHHHHQSVQHESAPKWSSRKTSLDEFRSRVLHTDRKSNDEPRPRSARRPSFRRALSIINDAPPPLPNQSPMPAEPSPRRKSFSRKRASAAPAAAEPLGPSQYYQDPEARMKLKLLLSSQQDFEEVIEHGFPASPSSPTARNFSRPRAAVGGKPTSLSTVARANNDAQRFLRNEILSLFDDGESFNLERDVMAAADGIHHDDDDDTSMGDLDSPITPHDADSLRPLRVQPEPTGNPTFFFPESVSSGHKSKPSMTDSPGVDASFDLPTGAPWPPREMTLRMTLTRPELRAPSEAIYGFQSTDPLALEDLPQLEDHAAFRRENKSINKFWRKMKPGQKK